MINLLSQLKNLVTFDREYSSDIQVVREEILRGVMLVCAIVGFPAIIIGSIDSIRQGEWFFGLLYISIYLIIPLFIVLAKHINYNIRAIVPLVVNFSLSVSILLRIGLSGVGSELLIACSVLSVMFYKLRFGLITMAAGVIALAGVALLMITGIIPLNPVTMMNSASPTSWIATIMTYVIITMILALSPIMFQKKLHDSAEQYRYLVTYSPAGICEIDIATGNFTFVNDVICHYSGYTREELMKMNPLDLITGDGVSIYVDRLGQVTSSAAPTVPAEYRIKTRDGNFYEVAVYPRYTYSGAKVVKAMYVIHDISERKKWECQLMASLQEKEILLKEIHHRVKNNMQVISSLLSLQAHHIKDERDRVIFTHMQNRVRSMASVHEKLYHSKDLSSVDMGEFISSLVYQISDSTASPSGVINVRLEVAGVFFTIEKAIPCTLIINELVTNAYEHAFINGRRGTISVSLDETAPGSYRLVVADDGVGMPEGFCPETAGTLGMKLVVALTQQLQGSFEIHGNAGTTCAITF